MQAGREQQLRWEVLNRSVRVARTVPGRLSLAMIALLVQAAMAGAGEPAEMRTVASIEADTVWEGKLAVTEKLTVPAGVTLTIRPGCEVRFSIGAGLTVQGVVRAEGTAQLPTTLAGASGEAWGDISLLNGTEASTLKGLRVQGARALVISAGQHVVEGCELSGGAIGIDVGGDGIRPILRGNRIRGMREGGIRCLGKSTPQVSGNTLEDCGHFGIHASQSAAPIVENNTVVACATGIELIQTAPYVRNNTVRRCERGIALTSVSPGKPVQGNTVEECGTGIYVQQFSDPQILENTITRNTDGILCYMGARPLIRNNTIADNATGIACVQLANADIEANVIAGNKRGLFLDSSSYARINGNNVTDNGVHLELGSRMSADWEERAGNKPRRGLQELDRIRSQRTESGPPVARGRGDGAVIGGSVDATGNWWGESTTREMTQKGADADISGLIDAFDVPTQTYEGYEGMFASDRIRYAPWAAARIDGAGVPRRDTGQPPGTRE